MNKYYLSNHTIILRGGTQICILKNIIIPFITCLSDMETLHINELETLSFEVDIHVCYFRIYV